MCCQYSILYIVWSCWTVAAQILLLICVVTVSLCSSYFQLGRQKAAKDAEREAQKLQQELYANKGVRIDKYKWWIAFSYCTVVNAALFGMILLEYQVYPCQPHVTLANLEITELYIHVFTE